MRSSFSPKRPIVALHKRSSYEAQSPYDITRGLIQVKERNKSCLIAPIKSDSHADPQPSPKKLTQSHMPLQKLG